MKTEPPPLAPMGAASLLGGPESSGRQARYSVQRDDSCGAQVSGAPYHETAFYRYLLQTKNPLARNGFSWIILKDTLA